MGYILTGMGALSLLLGGLVWYQTDRLELAMGDLTVSRGELNTCAGRLGAILRDVESDNAIDDLDLRDFRVPDHWLHGDEPAAGN